MAKPEITAEARALADEVERRVAALCLMLLSEMDVDATSQVTTRANALMTYLRLEGKFPTRI